MEVRLARHGRNVAIVTMDNQPRLNALTRAMLTELGRLWDELPAPSPTASLDCWSADWGRAEGDRVADWLVGERAVGELIPAERPLRGASPPFELPPGFLRVRRRH